MTFIGGGNHTQLAYLYIRDFKPIRDLEIRDIDRALILVDKNNTGKTSVLDAVCAMCGCYQIQEQDSNERKQVIRIGVAFSIEEGDLEQFHRRGVVSQCWRYDAWKRVFEEWLPSFRDDRPYFTFHVSLDGRVWYKNLYCKSGPYIPMVLPHTYRIIAERELNQLQNGLSMFQEDEEPRRPRSGAYIFGGAKKCNHYFQCTGLTNKKRSKELTVFETTCLLGCKIYQLNLSEFSRKVNENLYKNGGHKKTQYTLNYDTDQLLSVEVTAHDLQRGSVKSVGLMGKGMRNIHMLSLLKTYISEQNRISSVIVVEDLKIFLHPQLQKTCSGILYRPLGKNRVIFKTHNPDLFFNSSIRQVCQMVSDEKRYSVVGKKVDLREILDDLGYGANDLLNVSPVFTVEGKQDKSRLPLLLEKYYSKIYDSEGKFSRISVIITDNCINIKTYVNLKYMDQVHLRGQFLTVRGGGGKDPEELASQPCKCHDECSLEDVDRLPKVTRHNVLILKYYSFENYFLNLSTMAKPGVAESEEAFYRALYGKWCEYLCRTWSRQQLKEIMGRDFTSCQDMRERMEEIKTYMKGHSLYDIFYGPFRERGQEVPKACTDIAPSGEFKNILGVTGRFIYFNNRKKEDAIVDK